MKKENPQADMLKNFITFEGCEGVGKSTQVRLIYEYMLKKGHNVIMTREPGGSQIAEKIRGIILDKYNLEMGFKCELLLYLAARAQHLIDIIVPALERGQIVLCDRYIDSTYAYQGIARDLGADLVKQFNHLTVEKYVPGLTVFLNCAPGFAFKRKGGADKDDRLETEDIKFHNKVYRGYLEIVKSEPERFISVDARGSKDETHQKIIGLFQEKGIL